MFWQRQRNRWSWWTAHAGIPVWYAAEYRLNIPALNIQTGFDLRRAERVVSFLLETRILHRSNLRHPARVDLASLLLVHDEQYLDRLTRSEHLAEVFALHPNEIPVEAVLDTVRRAVQATIDAARESLLRKGPTLNLLGGFHHAARGHGAGFSAINDIAVAIAVLRREGLEGRIAVIDLDAHPPDGLADCLGTDATVWIGSISATSFGDLPQVDEIRLPPGTRDDEYLRATAELIRRCPEAVLTFVIAGGDCLAGDRLGGFGLTFDGVRQRDQLLEVHLRGRPSVWLPAGGYSHDAWRVLTQTALVLVGRGYEAISPDDDAIARRMARIAQDLPDDRLGQMEWQEENDWLDDLVVSRAAPMRFLGYYSPSGIEFALHRYGVLDQLHRLGYSGFQVVVDRTSYGERLRLFGHDSRQQQLLAETVVERSLIAGEDVLYVHWLELRHPNVSPRQRRYLPGQNTAGLGLLREVGELFALAARRTGLHGFAFAPAHYHVARLAWPRLRFLDEERQGRFEAMLRDFDGLPLDAVSHAVDDGRCLLNGFAYTWEPSTMVCWLTERQYDAARVAAARDRAAFALREATLRLEPSVEAK